MCCVGSWIYKNNFGREVWAIDINLGVIRVQMTLKLRKITYEISVEPEMKSEDWALKGE
jgi:hypothetical protein